MGSLILTLIELAKTIATVDVHGIARTALEPKYHSSVSIARSIAYVFRFLFHCVQFSFLFRYGNVRFNDEIIPLLLFSFYSSWLSIAIIC